MKHISALALAAVVLAACGGPPILANAPLAFPSPAVPSAGPPLLADPIPISFPVDDGPHHRLTEWWYYTGHLRAADGQKFGFEAVIFRAERGSVPAAWAAHLALTDEQGQRFLYAQRSEVGAQVDRSPRAGGGAATGFALDVSGSVADGSPWELAGSNGTDHISAALSPSEAAAAGGSFGLSLDLSSIKQPALHGGVGFVDFGPAGSSYYYSRTRMSATGELTFDGNRLTVEGTAWFDHQWGDFISVGGGGWDWFAINLDDGTDLTISVVLDDDLEPVFSYATIVTPEGEVFDQAADFFGVTSKGQWTSALTGRTYPSGWRIGISGYDVDLAPTVMSQELDTRATTGVIYWEGSQHVSWRRSEAPSAPARGGEAYVEITRYGP